MLDIIIVGAGGFGRELRQYVLDMESAGSGVRFKGFLDDDPAKLAASGADHREVLDALDAYLFEAHDRCVISVGTPALRSALAARLDRRGARYATLVHPTAYVAGNAQVGEGCIVGPFATAGANVLLGRHVVLNLYAAAGHDSVVGGCCVFSPHSLANGGSRLDEQTFLGSHAVLNPGVRVGRESKIAAGSIVYDEVPAHSFATGNPATVFPLSATAVG